MPLFCLGPIGCRGGCTLSKHGKAISLRYVCPKRGCREQRCRTHCRCGRESLVAGRARARPSQSPVPAARRRVSLPNAPVPVPRPIGRPAELGLEVLTKFVWYQRLVSEVRSASEVTIASYHYDHAELQCALLRRLSERGSTFAVEVLVDRDAFLARQAVRQRPRLSELRRAGAKVYLCRGTPPLGVFHLKAAVLDRRVCFTGSANFTNKSLDNLELTMRIVGPQVVDILEGVQLARGRAMLWDGSL